MRLLNHLCFYCFVLAILFVSRPASAQTTSAPIPADSTVTQQVDYAFLPALAYSSDLGLIGGGIMSRYKFEDGIAPFYSYLHVNAIISTKGLISSSFLFDKPRFLGKKQRFTSEFYVSRFLQSQFYGIGNYAPLPDALQDSSDFYFYRSFSTGIELLLRRQVLKHSTKNKLDIYGVANFEYRTPWGNDNGQYIIQQQPLGVDGMRAISLGGGLVWENRDSEFEPTKGNYAKAGIKVGNSIFGSSADYFLFESDVRAYTHFFLLKKITFANRLSFQHSSGNVPYWLLPELGGEETMRGYPENRFRDDNTLLLNTELRTWLLEFPEYDVRLGGTLFMDIGRTFANKTAFGDVIGDLNYTFGFGGTSSFFNNNFILRGDVGFSGEGYGIYFTAGYLF